MANSIELSNWSQEHSNHGSSTQGPGSIAMPDHTVAQIYFQGGIELGLDPGDKIDLQVDGSSIYSISRTGDDQWIEDVANDVTKNATSGGTLYFTLPHTAGAMNVQVVATCEPTDTWKIQEISVLSKNSDALVELNANAYEGGQPGSFRFTRTGDGDISKAVNIRYTVEPVDPDPAVEGLDFERLTGSVTILAGQETALVPVEAVDDIDFEYP